MEDEESVDKTCVPSANQNPKNPKHPTLPKSPTHIPIVINSSESQKDSQRTRGGQFFRTLQLFPLFPKTQKEKKNKTKPNGQFSLSSPISAQPIPLFSSVLQFWGFFWKRPVVWVNGGVDQFRRSKIGGSVVEIFFVGGDNLVEGLQWFLLVVRVFETRQEQKGCNSEGSEVRSGCFWCCCPDRSECFQYFGSWAAQDLCCW